MWAEKLRKHMQRARPAPHRRRYAHCVTVGGAAAGAAAVQVGAFAAEDMAMAALGAAAADSPMNSTIPVQDLRVGMFVHLDLSWMRHPFALSAFRIQSPEQIEIIRGLGLAQVRWDPAQSATEKPVETTPPVVAETAADAARRERREALTAQRQQMTQLERECQEAGLALRDATRGVQPVSYTHLTLPTNREV